jgi:hypothetical protein
MLMLIFFCDGFVAPLLNVDLYLQTKDI